MLQNEGLKYMTSFLIPIVKSNTPLCLRTLIGKHHMEAFAITHQVAEL